MDLLDFSSDSLFPTQNYDELLIRHPVLMMDASTTEQPQEIENQQIPLDRIRNIETAQVSTGSVTNQTTFHSAPFNSDTSLWNWVNNTYSASAPYSQEESQTVLQPTHNNDMYQDIPEVTRTVEATSLNPFPQDLSEINVSSIDSPHAPSPYFGTSLPSLLNDRIAPEPFTRFTTSYTAAPTSAHSTAFVNPGLHSQQPTNQTYPYLMPNIGHSSCSTSQQNVTPVTRYDDQPVNIFAPPLATTSGYLPSSSSNRRIEQRNINDLNLHNSRVQSTSETSNGIIRSTSRSSRMANSRDEPTQSRMHPYYTPGQQQQRDSAQIMLRTAAQYRLRRLRYNQNSTNSRESVNGDFLNAPSASSDSTNYYQGTTNQQTSNHATTQTNLTAATVVRTQPTRGFSQAYQAWRETSSSFSNNSIGGTSVFLPFNQAKQGAGCNNQKTTNLVRPCESGHGPQFSAILQVTAARQLLFQAASSASAAGATEFSQSLTERTQNLESLINAFYPGFLGGRAQMKAILSHSSASNVQSIPRIPTCSVCLDKIVSTILFPCRHFICENCAPKIDKCGLCREIIEERHRVYF